MFLAERSHTRRAKSQLLSTDASVRLGASGNSLDQPDGATCETRTLRYRDFVESNPSAVQAVRQSDGEGTGRASGQCRSNMGRARGHAQRAATYRLRQLGQGWLDRRSRKPSCRTDRTSRRHRRSRRIPPCPSPSWTICPFPRTSMRQLRAAPMPPPRRRRRETTAGIWSSCALIDASPRRRCCPSLRACLTNM